MVVETAEKKTRGRPANSVSLQRTSRRAINLWAKNSAIVYLRSSGNVTRKNGEINMYEISLRRRNGAEKESKSKVSNPFYLSPFFSLLYVKILPLRSLVRLTQIVKEPTHRRPYTPKYTSRHSAIVARANSSGS